MRSKINVHWSRGLPKRCKTDKMSISKWEVVIIITVHVLNKFSSLYKIWHQNNQVGHDADTLLIHLFDRRFRGLEERGGIQWMDHSSTTNVSPPSSRPQRVAVRCVAYVRRHGRYGSLSRLHRPLLIL